MKERSTDFASTLRLVMRIFASLLVMAVGGMSAHAQSFAYVTNENDNTVSVINTASNMVVATVPVGNQTPCLAVSAGFNAGPTVAIAPDGAFAYVTNCGDNTVSVINTANNMVVVTVPGGNSPYGVAITPDGAFAYVTNCGANTVSVINTANNSPGCK